MTMNTFLYVPSERRFSTLIHFNTFLSGKKKIEMFSTLIEKRKREQ